MKESPDALNVGVDISKATLEVCLSPQDTPQSVPNDPSGWSSLCERLRGQPVARVVLEPSGGYERGLVRELATASLPVVLVNPRQVRDFAKALGIKAKTDPIDARLLALYAERIQPEIRALPDEAMQAFSDLLTRRRQLVTMRAAELTRRHQASGRVRKSIEEVVNMLDQQIAKLEQDMDDWMSQHPMFQEREQRLQSAKGVGPIVSRALIGELPELGRVSHKEIAALVGLAPFAHDSGKHRGLRRIQAGRTEVRRLLILAARMAVLHEPSMRAFYQRLLAAGKPKTVALTAAARKLLVRLNAMTRSSSSWNPPLAA